MSTTTLAPWQAFRPDQHTGSSTGDWVPAPVRTEWGVGMRELTVALNKDATLRVFAHEDELHLFETAMRVFLRSLSGPADDADAERLAHQRELAMQRNATSDIAMAASIKLATARQVIMAALQSGRLGTELTMALSAVFDVLPAPKALPGRSTPERPALNAPATRPCLGE